MGSACPCFFIGSRRSNRILPTNSTVLARNKDLASYRRHRKRCEAEHGSPVASASLSKAETIVLGKGENSNQEHLEGCISNQDSGPDEEMEEWINSIFAQNNLLPSYMTFDNKRHLSMRSKYADVTQVVKLCNVIDETREEEQNTSQTPLRNLNGLKNKEPKKGPKKSGKQDIQKILSHETFNMGLGPTPKVSTRISKNAVKRNKQKDSQLRFHGCKSPPPLRSFTTNGSSVAKAGVLKNHEPKESQGSRESGLANSGQHLHISSNWLDEDFEESILSYPKETAKVKDFPQCLTPKPDPEDRGKRSIKFKIEPEISEPAVHNLGLFLAAVDEDQTESKSRTSRIFSIFRKTNRTSASYATEDSSFYNGAGS